MSNSILLDDVHFEHVNKYFEVNKSDSNNKNEIKTVDNKSYVKDYFNVLKDSNSREIKTVKCKYCSNGNMEILTNEYILTCNCCGAEEQVINDGEHTINSTEGYTCSENSFKEFTACGKNSRIVEKFLINSSDPNKYRKKQLKKRIVNFFNNANKKISMQIIN